MKYAPKGTEMTYAISANGLAIIQRHEGFRAEPVQMPDGAWVVGYSHVRAGEPGPALTEVEAADLLTMDVAPTERLVNALVKQPLTQSQFDALVSFAFSIGGEAFATSQVLRRVNAGDFVAAACAMDAWRKAEVNGELEVVDALVRRRADEKALFLKEVDSAASPSVIMRPKLDYAASVLGAPVKYAQAPSVGSLALAVAQPQPVFEESNVVSLLTAKAPEPVFEPAARLTEILKSEPQTEALLLTQVANDFDVEDEGEIVTAHARPVARSLDDVRAATRAAFEANEAKRKQKRGLFGFFRGERPNKIEPNAAFAPDNRLRQMRAREMNRRQTNSPGFVSLEQIGLGALMLFGLGLISLGASLVFDGAGDAVEIAAAAAVVTPGLAATLMAAYGFWRVPREA